MQNGCQLYHILRMSYQCPLCLLFRFWVVSRVADFLVMQWIFIYDVSILYLISHFAHCDRVDSFLLDFFILMHEEWIKCESQLGNCISDTKDNMWFQWENSSRIYLLTRKIHQEKLIFVFMITSWRRKLLLTFSLDHVETWVAVNDLFSHRTFANFWFSHR